MATHTMPHTPEIAPVDERERALDRLSSAHEERDRKQARFDRAAGDADRLDAHADLIDARDELAARERWAGWVEQERELTAPAGERQAGDRHERAAGRVRAALDRTEGTRSGAGSSPGGPELTRARGNGDEDPGAFEAGASKLDRVL